MNSPDRRQFLRGAGTLVALPAFASLRLSALSAAGPATTASGSPLRTAFVFFPNGAIPAAWWPTGEGTDFKWSRTLAPLEKHKDAVQILGGLDNVVADAGPDGGGDHARGN